MAKAEKIYDIAEKLGYEGDTGGNTSDAINACADALGFVGPHARRITDALSDLKTVVGGGGGGGSYGPSMVEYMMSMTAPAVGGNHASNQYGISKAHAGSSVVYEMANPSIFKQGTVMLATGLTVDSGRMPTTMVSTCDVYAATRNPEAVNTYGTVRQLDVDLTRHETTYQDTPCYYWSFVINEGDLEDGEFVVLHPHA